MTPEKPKIIAIVGPTASGKTDLSLNLAKKFNGEIICADSRQIYKFFDIGTAKIKGIINNDNSIIYQKIKHYLIDYLLPEQEFSLAQFKTEAQKLILKITEQNKIPFLVGGTGLYFNAILDNLNIPEVAPNQEWRVKWEKMIKNGQQEELSQQLQTNCPILWTNTATENPRRLIRSLEICQTLGDIKRNKNENDYNYLKIGLKFDREKLYQKINHRVDLMFNQGLINEVTNLYQKYGAEVQPMSGIGYREFLPYLENKTLLTTEIINKIKEKIQQNTRHYAKRQITWFKKDLTINWVDNLAEADKLVKKFLE